MRLSIIIPAYNEEKRMGRVMEDYIEFFSKKLGKDFEFIIVVNNSTDRTLQIAQMLARKYLQVKVLNFPFYTGKGGAVLRGFSVAKGDIVGFADADGSTNAENFNKIYDNLGKYDGIIASRKMKGSILHPKRKWRQDLSSKLFNLETRLLFGFKYKDTQCGAKLFKKEIIPYFLKHNSKSKWGFDVELLHIAKKNGYNIKEHPIIWTDAEGGTLTVKAGMEAAFQMFAYRLKN